MSETARSDPRIHSVASTGESAFHSRIADLLDDVTVPAAASSAEDAAAPLPSAGEERTAQAAPSLALNEVAGRGSAQETAGALLPGEPLMGAGRRLLAAAEMTSFLPYKPVDPPGEPEPETPKALPPQPPAGKLSGAEQVINLRGRSDGVVIELGRQPWPEILSGLTERLNQSSSFFYHSSVALDTGTRPVTEGELSQVARVLSEHAMTLGLVRTASERTFQAALAIGMAATLEAPDGSTMAEASRAGSNLAPKPGEGAGYFVFRGYLRSGHRLQRAEHILVLGDINPGAEVISDGDVMVWGRLRGVVHAGAQGNRRALVAALDLEPTQLRIADLFVQGADPKPGQPGRFFWRRSQHKRPEIARWIQGQIVVEEWDISRPGGLISLQRQAGRS